MFYYGTSLPIPDDGIIRPGAWGRPIKSGGWQHGQAHTEAHLENVRSLLFPQCPSRLDCVFLSLSLPNALAFQVQRPTDTIYQAEICSQWIFVSDMALSRPVGAFRPDWPNRYWASGFIVEIGDQAEGGDQVDQSIVRGLRKTSSEVHEELVKLLPCQLRSSHHAVSESSSSILRTATRPISAWAAPEVLTAAPVKIAGMVETV